MPREVDESLIEATIRRIAEAQAARETRDAESSAPAAAEPPQAVSMPEPVQDRAARPSPGDSAAFRRALESPPEEPRPVARGMLRSVPSIEMPAADAVAPQKLGRDAAPREAAQSAVSLADVIGGLDALARQLDALNRRVEALAASVDAISAAAGGESVQPLRAPNVTPIVPRSGAPAEPSDPPVIDRRPIPKPLPPLEVEAKRGFDLLPVTYRVTVEDKRRGVDLVPLHRALLSMAGVRDMALLSYNAGAAIVSLETAGELDADTLAAAVSRAMSRPARAEVHSDHAFVVKLAEN